MLNQVTIQSQTKKPIKPLVEIALQNQLKSLKHGIERTNQQLAVYEFRYGFSTAEMEYRLKSGNVEDWTFDKVKDCEIDRTA